MRGPRDRTRSGAAHAQPLRTGLLVLACVLAAVSVYLCTNGALASRGAGKDLRPFHDVGAAVLAHRPVYAVPGFVYPPVAALLAVTVGALPFQATVEAFTALAVSSLGATVAITAALLTPRRWPLRWPVVAALALAALFSTHAMWRSVRLANVSLLLPLVVVLSCWAFARGRWHLGAALVVASLVVKPVLLALLLLPLLRGRWRVVAVWSLVGGVVTAIASLLLGLGPGAVVAVRSLLAASYFTGRLAPDNLSLSGLALVHGVSGVVTDAVRVLLVVAVAVLLVRAVRAVRAVPARSCVDERADRLRAVLAAGTAAQATLLLVGSISEVHYLPVLLPGLAAAATSHRPWPVGLATAAAAAFALARTTGASPTVQALLVASEVLALAACAALLLASRTHDGPPARTPAGSTTS